MKQGHLLTKRPQYKIISLPRSQKIKINTFTIRQKSMYTSKQQPSQKHIEKVYKNYSFRRKTDPILIQQHSTLLTQLSSNPQPQPFVATSSLFYNTSKQLQKDQFYLINLYKQFQSTKYKFKNNNYFDEGHLGINHKSIMKNSKQIKNKLQLNLKGKEIRIDKNQSQRSWNYKRLKGGKREYLKKRMTMLTNAQVEHLGR